MEAERSLDRQREFESSLPPAALHEVPAPEEHQANVIDIKRTSIEVSEHLSHMDARRERIVLYLLEQPNFSIIGNKVGILLQSLNLTTNEWSKARTGLVKDYGILLNREVGRGRANRAVLNIEGLLKDSGAPVFITTQVLEKFCDNIDLLEASNEDKGALIEKVDSIMEARQKKETHLQKEASLPRALTPKEKEQKKAEAEEVVKSKFPKQAAGNLQGSGVMSFRFDIGENFFITQYRADEYAKLYPLHKFLLATGLASTFGQEHDEYTSYLQRLVNKGSLEGSHYDKNQIQQLGREAVNLSLAREEEERYILSEPAFDVLSTLAIRRSGNFV